MRVSSIFALAASLSTSVATYQGFNYGATKSDGSVNYEADFKSLFQSAKGLEGTNGGFTSARLYTMIQGGSSTNESTQAIPAAIAEDTTLLLGLWASGGEGFFASEIVALQSALDQYGDSFAKLVIGISVGSEDLYRSSPMGQAAPDAGVGTDAATISSYITQLRAAIKGTALADVPVGHVDTWTAWTEGGVDSVIDACDFIGVDAYPYFQDTMANSISDSKSLFNAALAATQSAVGDKPIWITETGFPVTGSTKNLAVPSLANAKTYYDEVGCPNFGNVNIFWFTLQDTNGKTPNPSFGVIGSSYSTTPLFDLSCSDVSAASSSASSSSTTVKAPSSSSTKVSGGSSASATATASGKASLSSAASSLVAAASSGAVASSGSGLTPSEGAGNGVGTVTGTATGAASTATGSSSGNGTVPVGSGSPSGLTTSQTPSSTTTGVSTVGTNAANALSGSFAGAMGALMVAIAVL